MKKHLSTFAALAVAITALFGPAATPVAAQSACVVEYKAKRDAPLKLTYGTLTLPSCQGAEAQARAILADQGWILLKILSVKGG